MDNHGNKAARKYRGKTVACHNRQKTVQAVSRAFLNALAEHFHAVHEQCEASGKLKYNRYNAHDSAYHTLRKTYKKGKSLNIFHFVFGETGHFTNFGNGVIMHAHQLCHFKLCLVGSFQHTFFFGFGTFKGNICLIIFFG